MQRLNTLADVDELVATLFDPDRTDPVVVVTTRHREPEPLIDAERLAETVAPLPVLLLETGDLTRHLTGSLPDLFGVFGGAARIWWPGLHASDNPRHHPLVFCYAADEGPRAVQRIESELDRRQWQESRYLASPSIPGSVGSEAVVERLEEGSEASARVILAQPGGGEVELAPGLRAWLVRRRRDPELIEGADVRVVITGYDGAQPLVRRIDSPTPNTEEVASTTKGARPLPTPPATRLPSPVMPATEVPDLRAELEEATRRAAQMEARAEAAEAEVAETARAAQREIRDLKKERRSLQDQIKHLKSRLLGGTDADDPEDAFREQVIRAWERTTAPSDREMWSLADYQVGPAFLTSLESFADLRGKIVEVCTDVVSGRFRSMPGREHHELRTGAAGDTPQVVRADGAKAYRIAVQIKTPSARRLHYWRLTDGSVELSCVVLHDDVAIV